MMINEVGDYLKKKRMRSEWNEYFFYLAIE